MNFNGYKTYLSAVIVFSAAGLSALGYEEYSKILLMIGGACGLVGVRHAIEKTNGGNNDYQK